MSRTENVELTVLCLIQDEGRVMLHNRANKDWRGYTLPGGHVEPGESFVDDLQDLLKVINDLDLTQFQYLVVGDVWTVSFNFEKSVDSYVT